MTSSTPSDGQRFDSAAAARQAIRRGEWTTHTSGLAPVHVQGNVVILPAAQAADFLRFCQANPKPCPLLAVSDVGVPLLPTLGHDVDIRTDVPAYRVYRDGVLAEDGIADIRALWRDDLVSFVLGCSFSFEHGLMEAGIPLRHVQQGRNVAMYKTNIASVPAGSFHGPMVVSMRPMKAADAIKAVLVTARTPRVHGAPVHIGDPALIGIADLGAPDFGDAVEVMADELPVFWACGVTPQAIVMAARPAFCITHAPGHMLITDLRNSELPFA
jgi:uncharacterized protein YcsI (UPF0317 family)